MDRAEDRLIKACETDAVFVTSPANMRAISGFTGEGFLYMSRSRRMIVTDFRYIIAAKAECPGWDIIDAVGQEQYHFLIEATVADKVTLLGYEFAHVTMEVFHDICASYQKQESNAPEFQNIDDDLKQLRMQKTSDEIAKIEKAEAIGDQAFAKILEELQPGMTEKMVAARLEYLMKSFGADGLSFDTIVASGVHSAMPHAVPTDKVLEQGDFVTMDFGCRYEGYCSDMTRTIIIGEASERQREIYELVLHAQEAALHIVRPGMLGKDVDAVARNIIEEAGYGECFGHGLGHSVGLEIHEMPAFSKRDENEILPGMVITVEPGVYIEGFGGVRIEDVVCITENGCRNLTNSPKHLIEI